METEQDKKAKKKLTRENILTILIVVLIAAGILIMLYPAISNLYNKMTGTYAIQEFNTSISDQSETALDEQRRMAEAYNASLRDSGQECDYEYEDIMDFGNGMMGYIEIPVIDVYLPVYHSVDESVLSKGVGHISQTAFPIGGEGNHSVLSGHTGLPSAELFTDLTEVEEGDTFYIHILEDIVAYEVDQILVVLPQEADNLLPVPGMDYCTLITCTPYGVNSHRLLVRGHRVPYDMAAEETGAGQERTANYVVIISVCIALGIILLGVCVVVLKRKGIILVAALVWMVLAVPQVYAAEGIMTEAKCVLQVDLRNSGLKELTGLKALPVEVQLYKVADIDVSGNYTALPNFETLDFSVVTAETTPKIWRKLAADAAAEIQSDKTAVTASGITEYGEVTIDNLETGLYLIQALQIKTNTYIYDFTPFLISLPNNYYYSTGRDCWVYELTGKYAISLKVSRTERRIPEEPVIPEKEVMIETGVITEVVKTGDESRVIFYGLLILGSVLILSGLTIISGRSHRLEKGKQR